MLNKLDRINLKIQLKADQSELIYPFDIEDNCLLPLEVDSTLRVAEKLAEVLIFIGAINGGIVTVKTIVDKVKSIFSRDKYTTTTERVLLFLIRRFEKNGSGATVNELSSAIHRSKSSIRRALLTLQIRGLVYRSQNRFAGSFIWYYDNFKLVE
jgi:hypothetical protein